MVRGEEINDFLSWGLQMERKILIFARNVEQDFDGGKHIWKRGITWL